jgi:hypothetical protein
VKLLLDCIYTGRPSTCSTSYLFWKLIDELSAWRDDVFFYLLAPRHLMADPDELAFVSRRPDRVRVVPIDQTQLDRMVELFKFSEELSDLTAPGTSPLWDADAIVTSRIPQIANFRASTGRSVTFGQGSYRAVFGLEEMPLLSFRKTVSWGNTGHLDLETMSKYLLSDGIVVNNLWTRDNVQKLARQWLSPSRVRALEAKVHEAVPVRLERLTLKPKKAMPKPGEPFNVAFCGRVTGTRNFKEVAELFRKHFAFAVGKSHVRFLVSTQSLSFGSADVGEIDFVEVQHNDRAAFHAMLRDQAHVVVNLSTVEDFSLSTYEPLQLGVPVLVADREWADFLGEDYPFRSDGFVQAYGLVKEFITDYAGAYARFARWEETTWKGLVESPRNVPTAIVLQGLLERHEAALHAALAGSEVGARYRTSRRSRRWRTEMARIDPRTGGSPRLKKLGEKRFNYIKDRILIGDTLESIGRTIHDDWGECHDIKFESLVKVLKRFRQATYKLEAVKGLESQGRTVLTAHLKKQLSAIDELTEAVEHQRRRLDKALSMEGQQSKLLMKVTSDEMKLYALMLEKLGHLQLETGVIKRAPKIVHGSVIDQDGAIRQFSWAQEDEDLTKLIEHVQVGHGDAAKEE